MNERCPEGFCVLGGATGLKRRPPASQMVIAIKSE